ncbi:MAG: M23 family metallopeptidase [Deltaproteobacteria bacterium]|nr:M23 family metallopeptidase [Deltaproteobacteria bacterium]
MKEKSKKGKGWLLILLTAVVMVTVAGVLVVRMEGEAPQVELTLGTTAFGLTKEVKITVADGKSGLQKIWAGIIKDGREVELLKKTYASSGILRKGKVSRDSFDFSVKPKELGLTDGSGMLRLVVTDYSWRGWGKGNRTYIEKPISIDTQAPRIDVLTHAHNISPGGSALVVYKLSEPCETSGVAVGEHFYPGYAAGETEKDLYIAFFALAQDQAKGTPISLEATDPAGNLSRAGFYHYIKKKNFRKDVIRISDGFLDAKLPEFEPLLAGQTGKEPIEKFLYVNREIRKQNKIVIDKITASSDRQVHWKGTFIRLPGSASRAQFADRRSYLYKGKTIDHQVHLGQDLASHSMAPVPAGNSGKIVFNEYLGIYGNTIIIDHGYGLFSLYGHLSSSNVRKGQMVTKGDIIGHTGKSGMAGGDHLHFSMLVHNTFVTPLEWWDADWIRNNVTDKLTEFAKN